MNCFIVPQTVLDCSDPLQEYNSCGSFCVIGCDTKNIPRIDCMMLCNPGCFCKAGYIFENASDWQNSRCIPENECRNISKIYRF